MKRLATVLAAVVFYMLLVAQTSQRGRMMIDLPYETQGTRHWFATASGTGNCLSWDSACTFREAVAKCTDERQDVIWLSPEDHDTDNGVDANGTTISAKNVQVIGVSNRHSYNSRLYNTAASVAYVVQVTGHRVTFQNVRFTQDGETDVDATLLRIAGSRSNLIGCQFKSVAGAATDVGVLLEGSSQHHYMEHVHVEGFQDAGVKTSDASHVEGIDLYVQDCDTAFEFTHADDDTFNLRNVMLVDNTTGVSLAAGVDNVIFSHVLFVGNTTNVTDGGTYGGLIMSCAKMGYTHSNTYPANAGVTLTGGAGAWAQGNLTQIVPASTITTPFRITGFNIQSSTANNVYKVEFFYGQATGDNSLGVWEFTDEAGLFVPPPVDMGELAIPSNSYVGAKIASSSGGGDDAVITINYQAL